MEELNGVSSDLMPFVSECNAKTEEVVRSNGLIVSKTDWNRDIGDLYLNDMLSDITLEVEGQLLPAHKCIVAARSKYFFELIYAQNEEFDSCEEWSLLSNGSTSLEIFDTTAEALKQVLKYLYYSQLSVEDMALDAIIDLLKLSHRCELSEIVSGVADHLKRIIELDNVWAIYSASKLFAETNCLADFCLSFMDRSAVKLLHHDSTYAQAVNDFKLMISRSSFEAPEVEKFKSVYKWINTNPEMDSQDLVSCISLTRLGHEELLEVVRPTRLFSESDILDAIKETETKRQSLDSSDIKIDATEFTPKKVSVDTSATEEEGIESTPELVIETKKPKRRPKRKRTQKH